jgi:hypothetical protein
VIEINAKSIDAIAIMIATAERSRQSGRRAVASGAQIKCRVDENLLCRQAAIAARIILARSILR